jgi:folate-dependent phosphoribosylglycinamide formyltransferase PurN
LRIVFLTNQGFNANSTFMYLFSHVANNFDDWWIVSVNNSSPSFKKKIQRYKNKIKLLGIKNLLEIIIFYPFQIMLHKHDYKITNSLIDNLERPQVAIDKKRVIETGRPLNGLHTISAIKKINPDIIIQCGAGILNKKVFSLPKIYTINLHHGIAPLIRGMSSVYWALWEQKKIWIGSTVHIIDKGIDTGKVLAYSHIDCDIKKDKVPNLFKNITIAGTKDMLNVLKRIKNNEPVGMEQIDGERNYRSTFSGLKRLILKVKYFLRNY